MANPKKKKVPAKKKKVMHEAPKKRVIIQTLPIHQLPKALQLILPGSNGPQLKVKSFSITMRVTVGS